MRRFSLMPALVATVITLALLGADASAQYIVNGQIRTPTGGNAMANDVPAQYIRVVVMDEDLIFDDEAGVGYTDAAGNFSIFFIDLIEQPDVYVDVSFYGNAIDGRFVEVRYQHSDSDPIRDVNVEGTVHNDISAGVPVNIGTQRTSTTRANIISQVCSAFRYLKSQYSGYVMPENLLAEGRTTNGASTAGQRMSISMEDYNAPGSAGNATFSDMHHETFHWVAYRAYGNRWPTPNCAGNPHSAPKETCEGFAMQEGSAQYFGNISAIAKFGGDNKTNLPGATTWRGQDGTGNDNSGEIVEGTFTRALRTHNQHPTVLQALTTLSPDTWKELKDGYAGIAGATAAQTQALLDTMAANGIVYTRGKIDDFSPDEPPDDGPPDDGNHKVIRTLSFVRGEVMPQIEQSTKAELNLGAASSTDAADRKDFGHKPAANGLNENTVTAFMFIGDVAWGSDITWNTNPLSDGDYDVITKARNSAHQWWDLLMLPDFQGDGSANFNSNEKWLKRLRTWYNQDPSPNNDKEGKVVVDNTSPKVENFMPDGS